MKSLTINFEYRHAQTDKNGLAPIYLRATYDQKHRRTPTGYRIEPKYWDGPKQRVKRTHNDSIRINSTLQDLRERSESFFVASDGFTLDDLIRYLNGEKKQDSLLIPFMRNIYEHQRLKKSESSTKKEKIMIGYVERFNAGLTFSDVDYLFRRNFERWLREQDSYRGGTLNENYISSIMRYLRAYLREAKKAGKIESNPLEGERMPTTETEKVYLTSAELAKIEALDVSHRRGYMPETIKMFLLCCYTGLAFIDAITLTKQNIVETSDGLRIRKVRHKTRKKRTVVDLPLRLLFDGRPEKLIIEQLNQESAYDEIFGPYEDHFTATYNQHLKEFARLAGINKNLSSHTARHTCAMILLNDYRFSFEMVAQVLGHTTIATTQKHYAKLLPHGLDDRIRAIR